MALTEGQVDHVAKLARLEMAPQDRALYMKQLNAVLEHAAGLSGVDVSGVPPTAHILPLNNVWRPDTVAPGLTREEALANAPDKAKGCFRVPKIMD